MKKQLATVATTGALVILGAGPALAVNGPIAATDGSFAQYLDDNNFFKICDIDVDGDWVYVKYSFTNSNGYTSIEYRGGVDGGYNGTGCIYRDSGIPEGRTVYYKSCQNDSFDDTCSSYKETDS